MAVSTHITTPREALYAPLTSWLHNLRERISLRHSYRRTLNELSELNAHQLADLGLHRSSLRQAAYEATYHQYR